MEKNLENNKKENTEQKHGLQNQFRVVINKEAQLGLLAVIERVNNGFDGGEITKSDLVNWMLVNSTRFVSDADVKTLRSLHFDEKKMLGSLLRTAGDHGALPDEITKALREHFGVSDQGKRRAVRVADAQP